jgi:four helix bundle protein
MGSDLNELRVFRAAEKLAQMVWDIVIQWDGFSRATLGEQLVRAADSVGANIAEAYGRYHYNDKIRFLYIARGSLYETRYWLRQAYRRKLLSEPEISQLQVQIDEMPFMLNNFINSIKSQREANSTKEQPTSYNLEPEISQSPNLSISSEPEENPF